MTKVLAKVGFDYDSVDKETKGKLLAMVRDFRTAAKEHASSGLALGKIIADAHKELAGDGRDGKFAAWVESELPVSRQTAYNYFWAWERFGKCKTVLHFFDSKALYKLASPNAPEKAAEAAIKRAEEGKTVTPSVADELIDKYSDKPKRTAGGRASTGATVASGAQSSAAPGSQPADPDEEGDPNEHCRQQIINEAATGDVNKPPPDKGIEFDPAELDIPDDDVLDGLKQKPPKELVEVFKILPDIAKQRNALTQVKKWLTMTASHPGAKVLESVAQQVKVDIDNADRALKFARPHSVCVYCKNKMPKLANCNACKGHGWITEPVYDQAPKELRK